MNQKTWEDSQADGDHTVHPSIHPSTFDTDADVNVADVVRRMEENEENNWKMAGVD